jgi:hypothetical protein
METGIWSYTVAAAVSLLPILAYTARSVLLGRRNNDCVRILTLDQ